jgi:uncharacterized repeat protein (TIGR01451 family)/uncharacterized delta-60 repeat protein
MQKETILKFGGKSLAPFWLCAAFFGLMAGARAQITILPANDNLTNAQVITGPSGFVNGSNFNATTEVGEPAPVATAASGASIWYLWTAPVTQWTSFNTRGSTDGNGNPLNTVLAVYSLTTGSTITGTLTNVALNYTNLAASVVATNVQDLNTNDWPGASRVDFNATLGNTYLIQVEGQIVGGVTNEGYITLNWGKSLFAGILTFSTNVYVVGQLDNAIYYETGESIEPSLMNNQYGELTTITNPGYVTSNLEIIGTNELYVLTTNNISTASTGQGRITITRTGGYRGRIQVDMYVTNGWYTNTFISTVNLTSIAIETISTNDWPPADSNYNTLLLTNDVLTNSPYTNIVVSNVSSTVTIQYDLNGVLESLPASASYQAITTTTSTNGVLTSQQTTNVTLCGTNAQMTANPYQKAKVTGTNFVTGSTNPASYVLSVTNFTVSTEVSDSVGTPSALPGIDFETNDYQTITLDDFQMSKDVFINILPYEALYLGTNILIDEGTYEEDGDEIYGEGGPDWPDTLGNHILPGVTRRVILSLVNPRLDPQESLDVAPPIVLTNTNTSLEEVITLNGTNEIVELIGGGMASNSAVVSILDYYNAPVTEAGGEVCSTTTTNDYSIYNFERRIYRTWKPRGAGNTTTMTLWVTQSVAEGQDVSLDWNIDRIGPNGVLEPASLLVGLAAATDNAVVGGTSYDVATPVSGTIKFPKGNNAAQAIPITIYNNGAVEFDMEFSITLTFTPKGGAGASDILGNMATAVCIVEFDNATPGQQPGGAVDVSWNPDYQPDVATSYYYAEYLWNPFPDFNGLPGADQEVLAAAVQADGKAIFGGGFHSYDSTNFNYLVRAQTNGFPDFTFCTGNGFVGPNDVVTSVAIDKNQKVIIGGYFTSYNGVEVNHVARLNTDGTLDNTFYTGSGANGTVWAVAVDPANNVIIGGDFTTFNSTNRFRVARLLGNGPQAGSLDTSFDPGSGADATVLTVAADSLTNVIIGGSFANVGGTNWPGVARLTPTGALDTNFSPGTGVNGTVYSLAVSAGNQIVIGGSFSQINHTNLNGIGRLNSNGTVDYSFGPGSGVNGPVYSVAVQPFDGKIVVGGLFDTVSGVRRQDLARFYTNGWVDTSFMDTTYNQFAGLPNHYYNPYAINTNDSPPPANYNTPNFITAVAVQPLNSNILIGGSFVRVGGGGARDATRIRWNVAQIIGPPTPGPQGYGGGIGNCPGNVGFVYSTYTANDANPLSYIQVERVNGSLGPATLVLATNLYPPGPGAAGLNDFGLVGSGLLQYPDYGGDILNGYGWRVSDGYYSAEWLTLTIVDDKAAQQNLSAGLSLPFVYADDTFSLGGVNIPSYPAPASALATLEIINDNFPYGTLGFSATNYNVVESAGYVTITVLRTNGSTGAVTVGYETRNGYTNDPGVQTAVGGRDYTATNGLLTFGAGVTSASFKVYITDFSTLQSNKFFNVLLFNPGGGATFDSNTPPVLGTNSVVTIVDNHFQPGHLNLNNTAYSGIKGSPVTVGVQRTGGALGSVSVALVTADGTGVHGVNYTPVSNWMTWTNNDVSVHTVTIQTLEDNVVEGTKTFNVILTNAQVANNGSGAPTNSLVLIYPTNAPVSIVDDDSYGQLSFYPTNINVLQNGGQAIVTVARSGGTVGTISATYSTSNGTNLLAPLQPALAGTNYGVANGIITFGPGVSSQTFIVPIYYTPAETNAANRVINLTLSNPNPSSITNGSPFPKTATITILDNQLVTGAPGSVDTTLQTGAGFNNVVNSLCMQPDGCILAGGQFTFVSQYPFYQLARLNPDGSVDTGFLSQMAGSDGVVQVVLSQTPSAGQTNGSIMVGGTFAHLDGFPRNNIGRLNLNGSVDETFNPGSGADNTVYALVQTELAAVSTNQGPSIAYYIGGSFANYNGIPCSGVGRVTSSGQLDLNFNVGNGVTSTNASVRALAVQADGKVIVGGDFTSFNNYYYHHLVRLNLNGSVDTTFNADTGASANGSVDAILIQPNGQIIIGGVFTNVNGVNLNHIARLNMDGSVDASFNVGVGANDTVEALALDSQGRILVAGQFTRASGVTRNALTRLNPDGTVDPDINFGAGANGYVRAIAIQANDEINVGGSFSTFGGFLQNNFTRLFGGEVSGPGIMNFVGPVFGVMENVSNAVITLQRTGGTGNATFPLVSALFTTADGTARNGVDYTGVTNLVILPIGETFTNVFVPIINSGVVGSNSFFNVSLSDPVGATLGLQPAAEVIITNANTAVAFSSAIYRQSENVVGGSAVIPIVRIGDPYSTISVTVYTGTNGSATPNLDYLPVSNTVVFYPGVMTNLFLVPLLNNVNMLSDQTVDLELANPVGGFLATPSEATLTIATVYAGPGIVSFSQPSYTVNEAAGSAPITLIRTNGELGPIAVTLSTSNGTAITGINYQPVNTVVNFSDSQYSQTVNIPIIQQTNVTADTTLSLILSNPQGTSISGSPVETLTIQNDIQNFTIGAADYFVSEGVGTFSISVLRNGPTNGTVYVGYTTYSPTNAYGTNGYAVPGVNYIPVSGILTFGPGQYYETFPVTIIQEKTVDGPETFQVLLTNASPGTQISAPASTAVTIIGNVTGFQMDTNAYVVGESAGSVTVTIDRLNAATGVASINYFTSDGSAASNTDYLGTNGVLQFADGQTTTNVTIAILNPNVLENSKSFNFNLTNPLSPLTTNCYLVSPSNAAVTITNSVTQVAFSSMAYTVSESNGPAVITVVRGGVTNTSVSVQYATADGTGHAGTNYFATSGTLNFPPGVTSTNFTINIIDDHIITVNHTVYLSLSDPQGGALLGSSSNAVLTILEADGALVVPAGACLVSGSTNGLIGPTNTVTIDLALRVVAGGNTTNLIASLQTNAAVIPAPGSTQTYGVLLQGGPVVFKPFTFTANGSNNQAINLVLQLQDGSRSLSNVLFTFTLGLTTSTYYNTGLIIITNLPQYGDDPTPASPYPSTIDVSVGQGTAVAQATVTIYGLTHSLPSDIMIALISPQTNVLLLNDAGGNKGVGATNCTITFSDAATNFASASNFVSGVSTNYKPTPYIEYNGSTVFVGTNWGYLPIMPSNSFPANVGPPYATNLSVFNGTIANGAWMLYVADTEVLDYGAINNGWSLSLGIGNPVSPSTDLELSVVQASAAATVSNYLVYTIALTNYGPAPATGVVITDVLPPGVAYASNNYPGTVTNYNGVLAFSPASLPVFGGLSFNVAVIPLSAASITNSFMAVDNQLEGSTNNFTNVVASVGQPSADVGVTVNVTPNPVWAGNYVNIALVVTNNGPSIAYGTIVTNFLPAGLVLTATNAPAGTTVTGSGATNFWNVGNLAPYTSSTLVFTAKATIPLGATVLDSVQAGSSVYDPLKLNNYASFKVVISPAPLISIATSIRSNTLTWNQAATNYVLLSTTNLAQPLSNWVKVTNVVPVIVNGSFSITLPKTTNGPYFFILTTP